jgi:hypothetical protein
MNKKLKKMKNLVKQQHGAGGFQFFTTENKGNTRLGEAKQNTIIKAVEDSWTEGVYQTATGKIKRQLLNGNAEFLTLDRETGEYYFS